MLRCSFNNYIARIKLLLYNCKILLQVFQYLLLAVVLVIVLLVIDL